MKTVLVTGGAGFIGSHIVDKLISKNYKVIVLDNLVSGKREFINPKAEFVQGDVTQIKDIDKLFKKNKIDVVFHIAGQPSIVNSFTDPFTDVNTNFIGTINMVLSSIKYGVERFLYASSMTVYGNQEKLPIKETASCVPINYYGVAKYAAERFVHISAEKKDLEKPFNVTSFRMFNVYGPRQSLTNPYQGVLAIFIGNVLRNEPIKIFGKGDQARDFIYVGDITEIWTNSIDNKKSFGKVFNIGYGKKTSIKDLAQNVIKACRKDNYKISFEEGRSGDQKYIEADISLAKSEIKFHPKYSLDRGLNLTLTWAKKNNSTQ